MLDEGVAERRRGPTVRSVAKVTSSAAWRAEAAASVEVPDERRVEAVEERDAGQDEQRRDDVVAPARSARRAARARAMRRATTSASGTCTRSAARSASVLAARRARDRAADALRAARDDDVVDGVRDDQRLREAAEVARGRPRAAGAAAARTRRRGRTPSRRARRGRRALQPVPCSRCGPRPPCSEVAPEVPRRQRVVEHEEERDEL